MIMSTSYKIFMHFYHGEITHDPSSFKIEPGPSYTLQALLHKGGPDKIE